MHILTTAGHAWYSTEDAMHLSALLAERVGGVLNIINMESDIAAHAPDVTTEKALSLCKTLGVTPNIVEARDAKDPAILREASNNYDLLVLGTHEAHNMVEHISSEWTMKLIHDRPIPIVIARGHPEMKRLLWFPFPTESMKPQHKKLIAKLADHFATELTLLAVEPQLNMYGYSQHAQGKTAENHTLAKEHLVPLKSSLPETVRIEYKVRSGVPESEILEEATSGNYDLIAVNGTHHSGILGKLEEDLPFEIACHADMSVLLLD